MYCDCCKQPVDMNDSYVRHNSYLFCSNPCYHAFFQAPSMALAHEQADTLPNEGFKRVRIGVTGAAESLQERDSKEAEDILLMTTWAEPLNNVYIVDKCMVGGYYQ